MIQEIRRFNEAGNKQFIDLLVERPADIGAQAKALAFNDSLTVFDRKIQSSFQEPKTRFELGANLWPILGTGGTLNALSADPLLWNWIAAALMQSTIGAAQDLKLIGNQERWVVNPSSRKFYRHLFAGAFFAYQAHQENPARAMAVLCQPLARPGEVVAQFMATDDLGYSVVAEVATLLYFDPKTGGIKDGVSGSGPGSARRLAGDYFNQVKLTVDFKGMTAKEIIAILPREYDHLKPSFGIIS